MPEKLRLLTQFEVDVLNTALRALVGDKGSLHFSDTNRWAANSMLEQKMPEHFYWASGERCERG